MTAHTLAATTHFPDRVHRAVKTIPGDPRARRLRVVCRPCNNEWMSQLQEQAKSVLLPLIEGSRARLRRSHQTTIASWATMFTMVAEQLDPTRAIVPEADRRAFKQNKVPAETWKVWIGNYERGQWPGHFVHNILPVYLPNDVVQSPPELLTKSNTQETAFVVGKLYFYTFSSALPFVVSDWTPDAERGRLFQVFPSEQAVIRWPPPALNDGQADRIANSFWNAMAKPHLR